MSLKIEKWERWFLYATILVLAAFFVAIIASIGEAGIHLPTDEDQIDPREVGQTPPFDNPGVTDNGDGTYTAVVVARAWGFECGPEPGVPCVINVPSDVEVEFVVTSQDVIHGFMIPRTTVNAMVIPGQITKVKQTFDEAGEHTIICHEFCGLANESLGHHTMFGKVVVDG